VVNGLNTVTIENGQDLFGWHYATLLLPATLPTVVEPASWGELKNRFQ